ncbi:hypothetical protein AGOR_G00127190 [Albula goreensis]|uniref:Histone-lysine N-methyltransferase n=1 Tax=Albula goreensis TaxID=1534307 RepID=A0A8T3DC75_9TELE|nr:hypothetical protein AGOR_G00127190 [Albula goreensis]
MAHSCRWRFPARPGGNSILGSGRRAGRVRVTAAFRTGTETHPSTNAIGLGFDAALQVSATIGNNLQKFRDIFGEASGSSSEEEEAFCGFDVTSEHRRIHIPQRPPAVKPPHEKRPRGRPPRTPAAPPNASNEKLQGRDRPPERPTEVKRPLGSTEKRRGRPPKSAQRNDADSKEHRDGGQQATVGVAPGQDMPQRERGPPKQTEGRTPRRCRFPKTKVKLKSSLRVVGKNGVAIPMAPRRRRGRPPSAERLRAGAPNAFGPQGSHFGEATKQRAFRDLDPRTRQHFKLRATQTADANAGSPNSSSSPATLGRVLGVRQSPRRIKSVRIVPSSRRSETAVAKQLLQRAKRGRPIGAGREGAMRKRRWTQLKNIRQFRMPVVSAVSMRIIKTPKRFIEDVASFGASPPHHKMARLDPASSVPTPTSPAPSSVSSASASLAVSASAGTITSMAPLAPPPTGPTLNSEASQHSSRSSSPSLDDSSSESQTQSPPPHTQPPSPGSGQGRMMSFGRGRRGRCGLMSRGRRKCLISPATGLLCSSSSQQASSTASSSSPPLPPLLAPPHHLQTSTSATPGVGERLPHRPPAWVMPHPMAPFLPPPAVLSPLQERHRSILRQPTFRWTSAPSPRQCFSSAKYAKEGLIRKPVFDNFHPPPLTAQDVGLLPPCAGPGAGVGFGEPIRATAAGSLFSPLPPHAHVHTSSRFGLPLHKLRSPFHKNRPLLRAPRFNPSEAHSRIFESITLPGPSPAPLSRIGPTSLSALRASSLIGQGLRRKRRGQPRSPSHSMTTRSSQSGAQAGKHSSHTGNCAPSLLTTGALTPASFSTFTSCPTSLPAEPVTQRPSSSSSASSIPLVFASGSQAVGRGLGKGGRERESLSPASQEVPAKEKDKEEQSQEEKGREREKECETKGLDASAKGILGTVECPPNASQEAPPCASPKSSPIDSTDAPSTTVLDHTSQPNLCPTFRLSKNGRPADRGMEVEEEEEEEEEEEKKNEGRADSLVQQLTVPAQAPALPEVGRQQVEVLVKKAKPLLCKVEKSRPLKTTESVKVQECSETPGRGPRIKHVCRRAAVALGRNRAVFPDDLPTLSALPWEERENILSSMGNDDKSSVAGSEEAEVPVPPMKPVMRPRVVPDSPARSGRRSRRCGQCAGCQVPDDCGVCANCLDKPKFGGRNIKKQCCKERKCQDLQWMPAKMFPPKAGKLKKDKKKKQMIEKKDGHHPGKTHPMEGTPKPATPTLKEEPARSETPPLKHSEEKQRPQPSSPLTPLPLSLSPVPEPKQPPAATQQHSPAQSQVPPLPTPTPPPKDSVTKPSASEPKKMSQRQSLVPPPNETASEAKLMKKLTPGVPPPAKNKAKEKEKQVPLTPKSSALNSLSTPSTGGAATPRAPCDGVQRMWGDFREDCDVEQVWERGGLSILTSVSVARRTLCLLCASSGNVEFVFCQVCCEPFHLFCLGEAERPLQKQHENWCCRRCRFCQACGQQDRKSKHQQQLLECQKCGNSYHTECLGPKHPHRPSKKNRVWICTKCVCCKSCGSTSPGKAADAQWSHDFSLCHDCAKLFAKGNFCPLCDKCYDDDDYESKMMQCGRCARWVHARCENLTDEMYEILSNLPESVAYTCTSCTQRPPAEWRTALEKELQGSVRRVLTALLNSRTSTHLMHYTPAVMKLPELNLESEESPSPRHTLKGTDPPVLREVSPSNESPLDLESVKRKMDNGLYHSVLEFSDDIVKIIQRAISCDGGQPENKKANSMVKAFFSRQMERVFPWFQVKESRFWEPHKVSSSAELLSDVVFPPSLDHNYAQCQEREGIAPAEQASPFTKKIIPAPRPKSLGEPDPPSTPPPAPLPQDLSQEDSPEVVPPPGLSDNRQCVLCLKFGDDNSNDSGRLLYLGQNEWAHVNCALWSVEVFEDEDGALKNIHMAVMRGKQLRCELCSRLGATVSCCVSGCNSKFHFMCARRQHCIFLEDKRVYCSQHRDPIKGEVVSETGFGVTRRILVDFEGIRLRRKFLSGLDPERVQVMIGSMTVDCLGTLTDLSDYEHHLFPIGYQCSRVYWSTVDARKRCVYTCRILACGPLRLNTDIIRNAGPHTSLSEIEPSHQTGLKESASLWSADSPAMSLPKPRVYMRRREPIPILDQSPCSKVLPSPGGSAHDTHGIVTTGGPLLTAGMRCNKSRQHSTTSPSPHPHKIRVTSPPQGVCITTKVGAFSSPPSLSSSPQHTGGKDRERERGLAVGNLSGEAGPQSKQKEDLLKKREDANRTTARDTGWEGSEDFSLAVTQRTTDTREKHSKASAKSSAEVGIRDRTRGSVEAMVREREKGSTAGLRRKASETVGKEKHPNHSGDRSVKSLKMSSSSNQRKCSTVEELPLRCEIERGLRASEVHTHKVGRELSQKEKKQLNKVNLPLLRMDSKETKVISTSQAAVSSTNSSLSAAAQGSHERSSSSLLFFTTSSSSDSSESESEHNLSAHHSKGDEDGPEEGEEVGSAADENSKDDSDGSSSAKRRYPQRSARARSNTFFGLTPFYGVCSYGAEDSPFHSHGEACGQKRAGGRSSKSSAEGQVDGADDITSSSDDSEEDEDGVSPCPSKDSYYYNFTRTVINPGIEQSMSWQPEPQFLKKEARDENITSEETRDTTMSLRQPRISQLDGVEDGSESDASVNAASTTSTFTTSTSNKSISKKKARESRLEQDQQEKEESSNRNGSTGRGSSSGRSRKSHKESSLPLGGGKSQGQDPLDAQLSLSTDLLKSDSDNTNSDDCGNILPSDIMEFVLNTPSMQALGQQPESSSSQLLSLDEGFGLDGNRGKDMGLFEDFPQQLPNTEQAERVVSTSVPGEEPFLPLELPSDLSVLTTRSSSVTSQNHRPDQTEPTGGPIITLPTNDSVVGEGDNKQREGSIASTENQQGGGSGGEDSQVVEGHMTPGLMEADCITSPTPSQAVEPANQEVTRTSGTSGLQILQEQKYVPAAAGTPSPTNVGNTVIPATHLKPGHENLIVVNQHMQPLYVLQTLPSGVTQKIQITPSVSTTAVMDTSPSLFSPMAGGLTLTTGLHPVPAPESTFPTGSKDIMSISHHQIHTITGTAQAGCQPVIPSTSSGLLIGVHPSDPHILVSEAVQHPDLAPKAAIVSCSSSMSSSAHGRKRPISRLQPRKSKKLARTRSQPANMTVINLSPTQITAGIPAQSGLVELGTLTTAAATPHRKVPNIIKRPKPGVMYLEPTTLLPHGASVSAAQPAILGYDPSTQLLPCTLPGLNPNQPVLNVLSVPAGGTGSILSTPALTGPISSLLLKASQQSLSLPDHQMVLQPGTPVIPQLSSATQSPITSSICVLPPQQLPPHQTLSVSTAPQGAQQLQHTSATGAPAHKLQPSDHSMNTHGPVLISPGTISSQNSHTIPTSWTIDQQQASKGTAIAVAAPLSGKGKLKTKRAHHSPDKSGVKKHKSRHSACPQEPPEEPNPGSHTSSTPGLRVPNSSDPMDTQNKKEKEAKSRAEFPQKNPRSTAAPGPQKEERSRSPCSTQRLLFEICSDDGFHVRCETIEEAWKSVTDKVQEARSHAKLKELSFQGVNALQMLGVIHHTVVFLLEQLHGAQHCRKHRFRFHKPEAAEDPHVNPHGTARAEPHHRRSLVDMFSFLASKHRKPPRYLPHVEEEGKEVQLKSARRGSSVDLPMPMRLRRLKKVSKKAVGVYRSAIHGRGLFCRKNIDAGEMVIEYSGTVIRSVLTEKRQKYYESKGIGSYMFRIDDYEVVDATMHGNAARFINHSCEPNCSSHVVNIQGHKHIIIFTLRKIYRGEEITYDYKFPVEGPGHKLPCNCGAKTCRKFLN